MEDYELVSAPDGSKIPKAALDSNSGGSWFGMEDEDARQGNYLRTSWETAKREGRLSGCGLMGNLTMDEIEELEEKVKVAMSTWAKLACTNRFKVEMPKAAEKTGEEDLFNFVKKLVQDVSRLTKEVNDLRKVAESCVVESAKPLTTEIKNAPKQ